MRKYWFIFLLYWQEGLTRRASFLMERFRAVVVLVSFYYFWSALLKNRDSFVGYDRAQMITYVLGHYCPVNGKAIFMNALKRQYV
jgi:ABC-type uncharacterized transport system permease subunit